jgi:hypothetical protein
MRQLLAAIAAVVLVVLLGTAAVAAPAPAPYVEGGTPLEWTCDDREESVLLGRPAGTDCAVTAWAVPASPAPVEVVNPSPVPVEVTNQPPPGEAEDYSAQLAAIEEDADRVAQLLPAGLSVAAFLLAAGVALGMKR